MENVQCTAADVAATDNEEVVVFVVVVVVVVGRFYIALFSALEQTHCARM